jgi:hypothetical protein
MNYEDLITALQILKLEGYIETKKPLCFLQNSEVLHKINKRINDLAESK